MDDFPLDEDYLSVMRCILFIPHDSDAWIHTNIFHTFVYINRKLWKLVIDGYSFINIVFKSHVDRFPLKIEPHPRPFKELRYIRLFTY